MTEDEMRQRIEALEEGLRNLVLYAASAVAHLDDHDAEMLGDDALKEACELLGMTELPES